LKSCQPAFLAEGNTKTPMYIGMILLILNIIFSLILMNYYSHAGIALATSISSWIGCIIYINLLVKNGKISKVKSQKNIQLLNLFSILIYAVKIMFISSFMTLTMKVFLHYIKFFEINEFIILSFLIILGLLMYFLTCGMLGYIPQELFKKNRVKVKKENKI
jgi:peptidoglycan biosynthesis protein MviN/MurJ (putative lipid II flippase)